MPDQRYEWVVLPQGMTNSPTICHLYVDAAIAPLRKRFPTIHCVHYMDDILLAGKTQVQLDAALSELSHLLNKMNLTIAPEKIQ